MQGVKWATEEQRRIAQRESSQRWRDKNPEYRRAQYRRYWHKNRTSRLEEERQRRRLNPEKARQINRASKLRQFYGLTLVEYETMAKSQGGVCAICRRAPTNRPLVVDHDHETNRIRGLLCITCNTGLASMRDGALFGVALAYLRK